MADRSPLGGLQFLPDNFQLALSTLASNTALIVSGNYGSGLKRAFLMKHLKAYIAINDLNASDAILVGFAMGTMSVSEIRDAFIREIPDPNEFGNWVDIINKRGVYWQTLAILTAEENAVNMDVKIGGKNGIPLTPGEGIQFFAYNTTTDALTTGSELNGVYLLQGAWLGDSIA